VSAGGHLFAVNVAVARNAAAIVRRALGHAAGF